MGSQKSAGGYRVNWINYPLKIKNFFCRIILEDDHYGLVIDVQEKDESLRQLFTQQWYELKNVLSNALGNDVIIKANHIMFTGVPAVRVVLFEDQRSWQERQNWPVIQQNLKDYLIKWDAFWQDFDDVFKGLVG